MNSHVSRQTTFKILFVCLTVILTPWWQMAESATPDRQTEDKILAELVALRLQIESAQSEKLSLEEQLQDSLQKKAEQEQELVQIRADLATSSKNLGKWVAFTYRHGYISFLEVLFSASDFSDFISRSVLLWTIMDWQSRAFHQNRLLRDQVEESLQTIDALTDTIVQDRLHLVKTIAELQQTEAELTQFLADLRTQSADLEARLNTLSQQWTEVTAFTTGILHRLSGLSMEELPPDSTRLTLGGFRLEYGDATINQAVKKVNPDPSTTVTVHTQPEYINMSGNIGSRGIRFNVKGHFEVAPDHKIIIFMPDSITMNGDIMEGQMLETILGDSDLTWDITRYYPGQAVTGVTNGNGKITFSFSY